MGEQERALALRGAHRVAPRRSLRSRSSTGGKAIREREKPQAAKSPRIERGLAHEINAVATVRYRLPKPSSLLGGFAAWRPSFPELAQRSRNALQSGSARKSCAFGELARWARFFLWRLPAPSQGGVTARPRRRGSAPPSPPPPQPPPPPRPPPPPPPPPRPLTP